MYKVGFFMEHKDDSGLFFACDRQKTVESLGKETLLEMLNEMLSIRHFESRAEICYQQGKIGGFLHLYIGQEAIQTAALRALGPNHWYAATYRCHGLALLLKETPLSLMAELFGKATGNAKGRGGSMHFYSDRLLGGFGIVGGQLAIGTGAALTSKYLQKKDEIAVTFFGDGATAQGTVHESFNLAAMWELPCLYVMENNNWSMGTPLHRTLANYERLPEELSKAYDMKFMRLDGMDIINCYAGFKEALQYILSEGKPLFVECRADRFRGHAISDPALYRTKEELKKCMDRDPILLLKNLLIEQGWLTEGAFQQMDEEMREQMAAIAKAADNEPWPEMNDLEQGVLAPAKGN